MPLYVRKHAFQLECRNPTCAWTARFYFDDQLPQQCPNPRCRRPMPKMHTLQTGKGYDHAATRKHSINTLVGLKERVED